GESTAAPLLLRRHWRDGIEAACCRCCCWCDLDRAVALERTAGVSRGCRRRRQQHDDVFERLLSPLLRTRPRRAEALFPLAHIRSELPQCLPCPIQIDVCTATVVWSTKCCCCCGVEVVVVPRGRALSGMGSKK
ncbi:unnamed protein product, partial [Ectocarpus sp. 4 AP-2014]